MSKTEKIISPLFGTAKSITEVKDEVFSSKMLGDGVAITPEKLEVTTITSPVNGTIQSTHDSRHAIGILSEGGAEILIHVGVDTVNLKGEGFKQFVKEGDKVSIGDKLLEVDFNFVTKNAPSNDVILIVTNIEEESAITTNLGNVTNKSVVITLN